MIKKSILSNPVGNRIMLHENPEVGDYVKMKGKSGNAGIFEIEGQYSYEIIGKKDNLFLVKLIHDGSDFEFHLLVDQEGHVKEAFLLDVKSNEKNQLRIARENETGYCKELKKFKEKIKITTELGTFDCDLEYFTIIGPQGQFIVFAFMTSPEVKFKVVRQIIFDHYSDRFKSIKDFVGRKMRSDMQAVEQGNKSK